MSRTRRALTVSDDAEAVDDIDDALASPMDSYQSKKFRRNSYGTGNHIRHKIIDIDCSPTDGENKNISYMEN
jgi:hypothetical protein